MNLSPIKTVKEKYGSKGKLVDALAGKLEKRDGEGKDALKKRLIRVSSRKLMNLQKRIEKTESSAK